MKKCLQLASLCGSLLSSPGVEAASVPQKLHDPIGPQSILRVEIKVSEEVRQVITRIQEYEDGSYVCRFGAGRPQDSAGYVYYPPEYEFWDVDGNGEVDEDEPLVEYIKTIMDDGVVITQQSPLDVSDVSYLPRLYQAALAHHKKRYAPLEPVQSILEPRLDKDSFKREGDTYSAMFFATLDGERRPVQVVFDYFEGQPVLRIRTREIKGYNKYGGGLWNAELTYQAHVFIDQEWVDNNENGLIEPEEDVWNRETTNRFQYIYDQDGELTEKIPRQTVERTFGSRAIDRAEIQNIYTMMLMLIAEDQKMQAE